jgi:hypothetical protein
MISSFCLCPYRARAASLSASSRALASLSTASRCCWASCAWVASGEVTIEQEQHKWERLLDLLRYSIPLPCFRLKEIKHHGGWGPTFCQKKARTSCASALFLRACFCFCLCKMRSCRWIFSVISVKHAAPKENVHHLLLDLFRLLQLLCRLQS